MKLNGSVITKRMTSNFIFLRLKTVLLDKRKKKKREAWNLLFIRTISTGNIRAPNRRKLLLGCGFCNFEIFTLKFLWTTCIYDHCISQKIVSLLEKRRVFFYTLYQQRIVFNNYYLNVRRVFLRNILFLLLFKYKRSVPTKNILIII